MENNTEKNADNVNFVIKLINQVAKLENKYGFFKLIKYMIILVMSSMIIYLMMNPGYIFEKLEQYKTDQHNELIEKRIKADYKIKTLLNDMIVELHCDRAFIFEFHNGTSNINGLPFFYADCSYEQYKDGLYPIIDDYQNVRLSQYDFLPILYKRGYWYGTIDELIQLDKKFGYRLKSNDVHYIALIIIRGVDSKIGVLGLTYTGSNIPNNLELVGQTIRNKELDVAILLSNLK